MEIKILGTSAMLPTRERNPTAVLFSYKNHNILVDCAEGTQRQFRLADISQTRITKLLITHWHGDHILGIPGLIQSLGANQYSKTLEIYGPKGTENFFKNMRTWFYFPIKINIKVNDIGEGKFFEDSELELYAYKLDHKIPCLAYVLKEKDKRKIDLAYLKRFDLKQHPVLKDLQRGKDIFWKGKKILASKATNIQIGKKICFITDTGYTKNTIKAAKDSDLLICESTFKDELKENARDFKHLTAKQAAEIAKKAKVKKLVLTHFSQRYKDTKGMKKEAETIFKNVVCANDFDFFKV